MFYEKLNGLLAEAGLDRWVEQLCEPHYKKKGRPGLPPGVYFPMVLGVTSKASVPSGASPGGAAIPCRLRQFLGLFLAEETPDHSSLGEDWREYVTALMREAG